MMIEDGEISCSISQEKLIFPYKGSIHKIFPGTGLIISPYEVKTNFPEPHPRSS